MCDVPLLLSSLLLLSLQVERQAVVGLRTGHNTKKYCLQDAERGTLTGRKEEFFFCWLSRKKYVRTKRFFFFCVGCGVEWSGDKHPVLLWRVHRSGLGRKYDVTGQSVGRPVSRSFPLGERRVGGPAPRSAIRHNETAHNFLPSLVPRNVRGIFLEIGQKVYPRPPRNRAQPFLPFFLSRNVRGIFLEIGQSHGFSRTGAIRAGLCQVS